MPQTGTNQNSESDDIPSNFLYVVLLFGIITGLLIIISWIAVPPTHKPVSFTIFNRMVDEGKIAKLTIIGEEKATGELRDPKDESFKSLDLPHGRFSINLFVDHNRDKWIQSIQEKDYKANEDAIKKKEIKPIEIEHQEDQSTLLKNLFWYGAPFLLIIIFLIFLSRGRDWMGDPMGSGMIKSYIKSPARLYDQSKQKTDFNDAAGMDNTKKELQEIVDFLKNPEKFHRLGAEVPKGVLLVGPPGTGKTLLARAVAGEAGVPFFSINGSEFIQMFVGVGASRVRDLFKTAKENSPCLIFIDEIDAVGRMRGAGVGGGSDEREQTLNQILGEMDGFQTTETVIVLAATNRPDVLDSALLRPGRFDRHITVDKPSWKGRLSILQVHTRNKPLGDDVDLEMIAKNTIGMAGADLRNLANEAALKAAREGRERINHLDFVHANDRIMMGTSRDDVLTEDEKKRTAYHEAGHALCSLREPEADKLTRVSILPRGNAGGVTLFQPDEDRIDHSSIEIFSKLVVALGGRAADRLIFGAPRSGASNDLKQATRIARMMVTQFGMSDRLGPVWYHAGEEHVFLGKEIAETKDCSEGTLELIDQEVQRLLRDAEKKALEIVSEFRDDLELITQSLLLHEELTADQVEHILASKDPSLKDFKKIDQTESTHSSGPTIVNEPKSQVAPESNPENPSQQLISQPSSLPDKIS